MCWQPLRVVASSARRAVAIAATASQSGTHSPVILAREHVGLHHWSASADGCAMCFGPLLSSSHWCGHSVDAEVVSHQERPIVGDYHVVTGIARGRYVHPGFPRKMLRP